MIVSDMQKTLILGGTSEASALAKRMRVEGRNAVFSYAGRTNHPIEQPLPMRVGGFGGAGGLAQYIRDHSVTHMIDATHPFAAQVSKNAMQAAQETGVNFTVFERRAWERQEGDKWLDVADYDAAHAAIGHEPQKVFLAIGKQNIEAFKATPQHHYLLRLVDEPDGVPMENCVVLIARGPFDVGGDLALLQDHGITKVIAKNAGGKGAEAKLIAARTLGIEVIMIDRPDLGVRPILHDVEAVLNWLDHG